MRDRGSRWSPQCLVTSQILQLWLSQAREGKVVSSLQGWPVNPGREPPDRNAAHLCVLGFLRQEGGEPCEISNTGHLTNTKIRFLEKNLYCECVLDLIFFFLFKI